MEGQRPQKKQQNFIIIKKQKQIPGSNQQHDLFKMKSCVQKSLRTMSLGNVRCRISLQILYRYSPPALSLSKKSKNRERKHHQIPAQRSGSAFKSQVIIGRRTEPRTSQTLCGCGYISTFCVPFALAVALTLSDHKSKYIRSTTNRATKCHPHPSAPNTSRLRRAQNENFKITAAAVIPPRTKRGIDHRPDIASNFSR